MIFYWPDISSFKFLSIHFFLTLLQSLPVFDFSELLSSWVTVYTRTKPRKMICPITTLLTTLNLRLYSYNWTKEKNTQTKKRIVTIKLYRYGWFVSSYSRTITNNIKPRHPLIGTNILNVWTCESHFFIVQSWISLY